MGKRFMAMLVVGGFVAASLGSGCGGDEEASGTTAAPLTKGEYVQQANAVCRKLNEKTAKAYEDFYDANQNPTKAELRLTASRVYLPNLEARLEALRELSPPAGDAAEVKAMLDALQEDIKGAAATGAIPYRNTLRAFAKANRLATQYGLTLCYAA